MIRLGDATAGTSAVSTGGAGGDTSSAGAGGSGASTCESGTVNADQVLWIGDSWVTIPGVQYKHVEELAINAGALAQGDEYVVRAVAAAGIDDVVNQYQTREMGTTKVKVLIMDGGTWDTLNAGGSDASVAKVVTTFKQLLATIASDGTVEHIIYYLMPELPTVAGVAALRPQLTQACSNSVVPCHFLDLQDSWLPAYTDQTNGIQASTDGATHIAELIWDTMRTNCIAQ